MTSKNSPDTVSIPMTAEDDSPGVSTSDEEERVPEGATYPLNSKKTGSNVGTSVRRNSSYAETTSRYQKQK